MDCVREFISHLRLERNLSENTSQAYEQDLNHFLQYCRVKKLSPLKVDLKFLRQYLSHLKTSGLKARSIARKVSTLKQFYQFCLREEWMGEDPSELMQLSVKERMLPRMLSEEEIAALIGAAAGKTELEKRDRAILEIWYATGCRISELAGLKVKNLDCQNRSLRVDGKGGKQRVIPIHAEAVKWCREYERVRHRWLQTSGTATCDHYFISRRGLPLTRQGLWKLLKRYARLAGIPRRIWPHLIRHSFATHILHGGADLRVVQELLGHQSISTTEIYTHLQTDNLKVMQMKYHPRG